MTGLDPNKDRLLEVACIITDGQLKPVDEGVSYVIQTDPAVLADMDEWYVWVHLQQVCRYLFLMSDHHTYGNRPHVRMY